MAKQYSEIIVIGAGASGIATAVQLKRKFGGYENFTIYERDSDLGGTWWANTYPGCACDVPAPLYSYSFAQNPNWSTFYPSQPELLEYFNNVADRYKVRPHIKFNTEVVLCEWMQSRSLWKLHLKKRTAGDGKGAGEEWIHEAKIVISCVGCLVEPKECDIPGKEEFKGDIFHSARWNHNVNLEGKNVIVIGNGCSATQFVPIITPTAKSVTQFARSKHYIVPRIKVPGVSDEAYNKNSQAVFKYIPFSEQSVRLIIALEAERLWGLFKINSRGARMRKELRELSIDFMKSGAPKKYWEALLPDFEIGAKRRIIDGNYLPILSAPNFHLSTTPVAKILPNEIVTASGDHYPGDAIVLANGFKTNDWLSPLEVRGINGRSMNEHWKAIGGPGAYNCTSCAGFPNFFMIVGPNTLTGHTSVLIATENTVNYALKLLKCVIKGDVEYVDIKEEKEKEYIDNIQAGLQKTVYSSNGKTGSWYIREDGWNSSTYPFSQIQFTYRSMFPSWGDWNIQYTSQGIWKARVKKAIVWFLFFAILGVALYTNFTGNTGWTAGIADSSVKVYNEGSRTLGNLLGHMGVSPWTSEL
ncbi:hypothetical protein RUND412_002490 [Rhizina undulata]